ncbi:nucleotide-diphospho-sugar transferase [Blakeslea trispora]|nr:nucleotide-diphospho-sugar transferase [Blakeslea trispora]
MAMYWTLPLKVFYSITISCIFVLPALIGYALKVEITRRSFLVLGVYGTVVFIFMFLQLLFASINRMMVLRYKSKSLPVTSRQSMSEAKRSSKNITLDDLEKIEEATNVSDTVVASSEGSIDTFNEKEKQKSRPASYMGLAVVGYREEPELFTQCLESIKCLNYPDPIKIIVVIDGDAPEDKEMAALFQKSFPQSPTLVLPELLSVSFEKIRSQSQQQHLKIDHDKLIQETFTLPTGTTPVCYMQPHQGKRHAMYTAFRILLASGCEAVMSTDSDTKFDPDALIEMESALHWFPKIGAVAGDVRIWNAKDSILSYMSSLRYWMAFNIERAAQSFNRCVTCVSGPMGIYRSEVLREILDEWISQSFLGMECTYGDDRHLTNRTLLKGYHVVYTHLAFCETETPTQFLRWFKQQTRWSKSFYREIIWNARSLHKHSPWMAAELFYQGIYPFVLLFSIFQILFGKSSFVLLVWLVSLMVIAWIKTIYSTLVTFELRFLTFPLYSLYYMFGLVPAKLWAIVSLWDVGWGTSARSAAERKKENVFWSQFKEALPIIVWLLVLFGGVAYNVAIYITDPNRISGADFFRNHDSTSPDPNSIVFYPNIH